MFREKEIRRYEHSKVGKHEGGHNKLRGYNNGDGRRRLNQIAVDELEKFARSFTT